MTIRGRWKALDVLETDAASGIVVDRPDAWSAGELARLILVPLLAVVVFVGGVYWLRSEHAASAAGEPAAALVQFHLMIPDAAPIVPPVSHTTPNEGNPSVAVVASRTSEIVEERALLAEPGETPAVDNPPPVPDRSLLSPPSLSIDRFQRLLQDHVARYQRYPSGAKAQRLSGSVDIQFVMTRDGRLRSAWIRGSSGHVVLDREAIATIQRAQPLPAIPAELPEQLTVTLPLAFHPT